MKLWKLCHNSPSASLLGKGIYDAFLIAEYASSFGKRIMCLDASFDEEVNTLKSEVPNQNLETSLSSCGSFPCCLFSVFMMPL